MNRKFNEYVARLKARYQEHFDARNLSDKFAPYFDGPRIEVKFSCGSIKRGRVGGTTGWVPSLMLLLRRRDMGSSWLLDNNDEIIKILPERRQ